MQPKRDAFVIKMEKRFADFLHSDDESVRDGAEWFIYGSQQYEIEAEAEDFLKKNPDPTAKELNAFFDRTCPGGLAPGDDGADLLDDDDE